MSDALQCSEGNGKDSLNSQETCSNSEKGHDANSSKLSFHQKRKHFYSFPTKKAPKCYRTLSVSKSLSNSKKLSNISEEDVKIMKEIIADASGSIEVAGETPSKKISTGQSASEDSNSNLFSATMSPEEEMTEKQVYSSSFNFEHLETDEKGEGEREGRVKSKRKLIR